MNFSAGIWLIEDNTVDSMFITKTLKDSNNSDAVEVFTRAEDALDHLAALNAMPGRNGEKLPRLIILDLNLPGMSGFDFLHIIRAQSRYKDIPIVVFAGSKDEHDRKMALNLGANEFITKAVDLNQFLKSVEEMGRLWLSPEALHQ